jgi:hypothetical protein
MPLSERSSFQGFSYPFVPSPIFSGDVSLAPFHFCTPRSSFCWRRLNSSGIHNFPGSVPSAFGGALKPDSGPYVASSVLQRVSLRFVPLGPFHAPSQTLSVLGLPPIPRPSSLLCRLSSLLARLLPRSNPPLGNVSVNTFSRMRNDNTSRVLS